MDCWRVYLLLPVALASAACYPVERAQRSPASPAARLRDANLPLTYNAAHHGLKEELAIVEAVGGLPQQLLEAGSHPTGQGKGQAASALEDAFPPISRSMLQGQLDDIYPGGTLTLSPVGLERARELVRKHASASEQFRRSLDGGDVGFDVQVTDGILADLGFLQPLAIGCRLEAIAAAVHLAENRPHDSLPHMSLLLRAARVLAAERNVTTRFASANLRAEALEVVRAIAAHPQATRNTHEQLFATLAAETDSWPDDAGAWIGDRAAGLLVYELVRDGQYLSLLSADEVKSLEDEHLVRLTAQAVMRGLDDDQTFYLRAMRQMIDACRQPHSERVSVLREIREELAAREDRADYPLVAGRLLLADFEIVHRRQAEDFARCQGWLLALGAVLGHSPVSTTNPLTGHPYLLEQTPLTVRVSEVIAGERTCEVPVLR